MKDTYILTVTLNPAVDRTILLPRLTIGTLNRALSERRDAGGKGINVSRVLSAFAVPTLACGFAAGRNGDFLTEALCALSIPHDFLQVPGETRENCKLSEAETNTVTEIGGVGAPIPEASLALFFEKFRQCLDGAEAVALCGSLPAGVPSDIYATLTAWAHDAQIPVLLDADGEALQKGLSACPDMIKPNRDELARLIGQPLSSEEEIVAAAEELCKSGIGTVVVSLGKDGSLFVTKEQKLRVSALPVSVGCATGAGDSMAAALLFSRKKGLSLIESARLASAAGSMTAAKPGTQLCTYEEVCAAAPSVTVRVL